MCGKCKIEKSFSEFNKKDKTRLQDKCRNCQKEYYKKYYQENSKEKERILTNNKNKKELLYKQVAEIKESSPCVDCGNYFPACCMDFDHIYDNKINNVSAMIGQLRSWKTISEEINKCELVCANCHRIRTRDRHISG